MGSACQVIYAWVGGTNVTQWHLVFVSSANQIVENVCADTIGQQDVWGDIIGLDRRAVISYNVPPIVITFFRRKYKGARTPAQNTDPEMAPPTIAYILPPQLPGVGGEKTPAVAPAGEKTETDQPQLQACCVSYDALPQKE